MNVVPFHADHLYSLRLQDQQLTELCYLERPMLEALQGPLSFTGLVDHRPIACAGITPEAFGSGVMWAFLGVDAGPYMLRLTRCGRRMLELAALRRVTANTPCDFGPGCRWLALLGFQVEGAMRKYGPDGRDHFLYARVA